MKSRPLNLLPKLEDFAQDMAHRFNEEKWNMGVDVVFYRDGKDYIGKHSDDDQGERRIVTVLLHSPRERVVKFETKRKETHYEDGHEQFELFLQPGDAYAMSKEMQTHYVHWVPADKDKKSVGEDHKNGQRLVAVFRSGEQINYEKDSGEPCIDLSPRPDRKYHMGRDLVGLEDGKFYGRRELMNIGAHRCLQRGVSGSMEKGCDAIVVSEKGNNKYSHFTSLKYVANTQQGAYGLMTSACCKYPIRVFRSTDMQGIENTLPADILSKGVKKYRYDGLFKIYRVQREEDDGSLVDVAIFPHKPPKNIPMANYVFHLGRIMVGESAKSNVLSAKQFEATREPNASQKRKGRKRLEADVVQKSATRKQQKMQKTV